MNDKEVKKIKESTKEIIISILMGSACVTIAAYAIVQGMLAVLAG